MKEKRVTDMTEKERVREREMFLESYDRGEKRDLYCH
jgi:hypothetical protein